MSEILAALAVCVAVNEKPTFTYKFAVERQRTEDGHGNAFPIELLALDAAFPDSRFDTMRIIDCTLDHRRYGNETRVTMRAVKSVSPWTPDPAWALAGWAPVLLDVTKTTQEGATKPYVAESDVKRPTPPIPAVGPLDPWPALMRDVKSSNIARVGYLANPQERGNGRLRILFTTGALYEYERVTPEFHREFMVAPSVGGFFAARIKNKAEYPYRKISGK